MGNFRDKLVELTLQASHCIDISNELTSFYNYSFRELTLVTKLSQLLEAEQVNITMS